MPVRPPAVRPGPAGHLHAPVAAREASGARRGGWKASVLSRKLHRWGAVAIAVPVAIVIGTGLLLQVKKQVPWVQPPERRGSAEVPTVSMQQLLDAARGVPQAGVRDWRDVDRVDVRPGKGIAKVTAHSRWEVQVDLATGAVLQSAYRRSDLIETLHDGSWFHDAAKLWVFLPSGIVLLVLWLTGIYLWWLPVGVRRRRRAQGD